MGFFKKKKEWIDPAEYTVNSTSTTKMTSYILDKCVYDKKALAALCRLVCPSVSPIRDNLKLIIKSAVSKCDTTLRHANKFYKMALSTSDIGKFFDNISVVRKDVAEIKEIERYICYGGIINEIQILRFEERLQIEIRHLIDRSYATLAKSTKPEELAQRHLGLYKEHFQELDEKSREKLSKKYKKYMEQ